MPSRYLHKKFSKFLVEDECEKTHKAIDYPVKFLGRRHRILFHDPISAVAIGLLANSYKGVCAGLSHIFLDYCCSKIPELKYLAEFYLRKKSLL
ncbi:MAG: hypothetical protein QXX38_02165 [Candidatus Aenigmatarchaeota archaeon]